MPIPVSGYGIPLEIMGLVTALVLPAGACSPAAMTAARPTEPTPTWDYVALGDSTPAGYGVARSYVDFYAVHIEADLGVKVTVHNWAMSGQTTGHLLDALRNNQDLRTAISEAEVVTLWTGWNDFGAPLSLYEGGLCGGPDNLDCIREAVTSFKANFDGIIAEILSLGSTTDTIIRIADVGNPFVARWKHQGTFEDLKRPCFEDWRDYIVQAASEHNIPVVHSYLVLNGPDGDEDPADKGLEQADGVHLNDAGHALIADLHREAGYEPLGP